MGRFNRYSAVQEQSERPSWPMAVGWATGFFTILPAPHQIRNPHGRDVFSFVVVGLILGVFWALTASLMLLISDVVLGTLIVGGLLVIVDMWSTGGMHADGVADVADGFAARRSGADVQHAMEDSAVGAVGSGYLVTAYIVRFAWFCAALYALTPHGAAVMLIGLAPVVAKGISGLCLKTVAPANGGLSDPLRSVIALPWAWAMIGVVAITAFGASWLVGYSLFKMAVVLLFSIGLSLLLVYRVSRAFNGIGGGDTCGTGMNMSEALFALGLALSTLV